MSTLRGLIESLRNDADRVKREQKRRRRRPSHNGISEGSGYAPLEHHLHLAGPTHAACLFEERPGESNVPSDLEDV